MLFLLVAKIYLKQIPVTADISSPIRITFKTKETKSEILKQGILIATELFFNNANGFDATSLNAFLNRERIVNI